MKEEGGKEDAERFVSMVRGGGCPCNVSTQVSDSLTEGSLTVADSDSLFLFSGSGGLQVDVIGFEIEMISLLESVCTIARRGSAGVPVPLLIKSHVLLPAPLPLPLTSCCAGTRISTSRPTRLPPVFRIQVDLPSSVLDRSSACWARR